MLTTKLFAALGIAGALTVGAAADANANPYFRPVFRAPVMAPRVVVAPRVMYQAPVYPAPAVAAPVYQTPVVYGATYAPVVRPVYGVGWRHHWGYGYRRW